MTRFAAAVFVLAVLSTGCSCPNESPADLDGDCVALQGYDPVAYHTGEEAQEGRSEIAYEHDGATYHFASKSNRGLFAQDPERYAVAYGGWCAYAVAGDGTFFADPESFLKVDGRVFMFHDSIFFDAKSAWLEKGHQRMAAAADRYWAGMTGS